VTSRAVNIGDLKNHLSAYLARVRGGEEILVRDRDVPFARIVPLRGGASDGDAELMLLAGQGKVRLPDEGLPASFWRKRAPRVADAVLLDALRAEREDR
jgi:antitoxin (DNA-binding transcriptional repressor) of toxin-antitoxin stability system